MGQPGDAVDAPMSGGIPFAAGLSTLVRIPIPFTNGLAVELSPRGWVPKSGSTSTLFFQNITGKNHLRLDFGYNKITKTINYHWNQSGTAEVFGITDHAIVGSAGRVVYHAARYFKYAGRVLIVIGIVVDVISIVTADKPLRRAAAVVAGWAGAWAGCAVGGPEGAAVGSLGGPIGTAVGGFAMCIIGGAVGYKISSRLGGEVYDWAADTVFTPLPEGNLP